MTFEQRRELKHLLDQAKRAEIAAAHGRTPESIFGKLGDCEHCGALIAASRRFCGRECITAYQAEKRAVA